MWLKSSVAVAQQDRHAVRGVGCTVGDDQIHLSIFVPIHGGQSNRPGPGGEFKLRTESAVAVVDQNRNSIGACVHCCDIRNVVSIKVSDDKLCWSSSNWITFR